jgi:hypothetical protein
MSNLQRFLDADENIGGLSASDSEIENLMSDIRGVLSPDLLKKEYHSENAINPMFGHCYVATEALYYLLNDPARYGPARGRDERDIVHWWLVDLYENRIWDATKDQYLSVGKVPPYQNGKRSGFLTNFPSKRCKIVLNRLTSHPNHANI